MARRPHRDGDRAPADPDLERLLDSDLVLLLAALRQPDDVNRLSRVGRRLDGFVLGAHRGRSVPVCKRHTFGTVP